MTTPINKVLTNQTQTLSNEELANVSASLSAILGQGGGGGGEPCASAWRPTVTDEGMLSWTLSTSTTTPTPVNIMGPSGTSGAKGDDGTSIILQSVTDVEGGKQVTLAWGETPSTSSFVIPSGTPGTPGTPGANGFSPTVSTTTTASEDRTGTVLTFTYGDAGGQTVSYTAWNGKDGTGATVDLLEGTGIQITHAGATYTIGVSADYALKSDITDMATKTWVGQQGYLTSVPDSYATKTYANDASANALSEAKTWVGDQGFLKSTDLTEYATKTYTNDASAYALSQAKTYADTASAEALSQAKSWTNLQNFATSAGLDDNKQYAMTKTGWSDFTIPSTSGYLPLSGGTVSGQLVVSGSAFDTFELKRSDQQGSTGIIGINGAGGMSFKIVNGNNNTQLNIAPNATMDKRFSIGDTPHQPAAYFIPAVTATTTAGLTDDGILHIILES